MTSTNHGLKFLRLKLSHALQQGHSAFRMIGGEGADRMFVVIDSGKAAQARLIEASREATTTAEQVDEGWFR